MDTTPVHPNCGWDIEVEPDAIQEFLAGLTPCRDSQAGAGLYQWSAGFFVSRGGRAAGKTESPTTRGPIEGGPPGGTRRWRRS